MACNFDPFRLEFDDLGGQMGAQESPGESPGGTQGHPEGSKEVSPKKTDEIIVFYSISEKLHCNLQHI